MMIEPGWHQTMSRLYSSIDGDDSLNIDAVRSALGISGDDGREPKIIGNTGVIYLHGPIVPRPNFSTRYLGGTAVSQFMDQLQTFRDNDTVSRIWIDCDSPGGSVRQLYECAELIRDIRQRKPIEGFVSGLCASAAYFLLSASTHITATPSSQVGSIGTIVMHSSFERLWSSMGVDDTLIFKGKFKADGHPDKLLTDQGRATIDEIVSAFYDQFWDALELNLGVTREAAEPRFGQGKTMIASAALTAGMVNQVADEETRWTEFTGSESVGHSAGALTRSGTRASSWKSNAGSQATSATSSGGLTMKTRIIAALVTLGVLQSFEPNDATYQTALLGAFRGNVPKDEADQLKQLTAMLARTDGAAASDAVAGKPAAPVTPSGAAATGGNGAGTAASGQPSASGQPPQRTFADGAAAERQRQAAIRTRGAALGVSAEAITAAIDGGTTLAKFLDEQTAALEAAEQPLTRSANVTGNEADRVISAAVETMCARMDAFGPLSLGDHRGAVTMLPATHHLSASAAGMRRFSPVQIAAASLRALGRDHSDMDDEQICGTFLGMGSRPGMEKQNMDLLAADGITVNRVGDYPDVVGTLSEIMLRRAADAVSLTYDRWMGRVDDVADLDPKTLLAIGGPRTLDELEDTEELPERRFGTEADFIQAREYGEKFGLSAKMFLQDKVRAWQQHVMMLQADYWLTLQELGVNILLGNPQLADGSNLFTTGAPHQNDLSSGAAPDKAQAKAMKKLLRRQTVVGSNQKTRAEPGFSLVGTEFEDENLTTFRRLANVAYTDTDDINVYADGSISPIVEPMLDDGTDGKIWFMGARVEQVPGIVYAFVRGQAGGRRETWYDPNRRTRWYSVSGGIAVAVNDFRALVRNPGQ